MTEPKLLIADDHGMIRRGLCMLIQGDIGEIELAEADSLSSVMSKLRKEQFTHLLLDVLFADGNALEILPNINQLYPALKIMLFSMQPVTLHTRALQSLNIYGVLSKASDNDTVIRVLTDFLNSASTSLEMPVVATNPFQELTVRELQILHHLLNGMGTKQIADTLNIKMNSVSTLKKRIYEKTATNSYKALVDLCTLYKINF
ncbi:response regulator transcription factor [Flavihumibacter cheonanensis]|uniref:response regulator transcription factor n=1 Tax=Flavihumibacter cheonanensis TaxID=1442385 RepID=UPI001EF967FA|nr:response regulator transcription factor [Flavihumibacter cheonanensis]MCG7751711.1 response regulator transcription factor [Flavihumibacter cheonanensis]